MLLILALIIAAVSWPIFRHYKKKAEDLKSAEDQEIEILDELVEGVPGSVDGPESNEDPDSSSD